MYREILKRYLDDLASKKPAPGGGSAAALVASTGAALLSMVANFTIGKEKYKAAENQMKEVLSSSEDLREKLLKLVDEDVIAYRKLSEAYKLSKTEAIQQGLKEALAVPLEVCKLCHQAIKLCPILLEKGNLNLISDVGVAGALLASAFQSALLNVEINLKGIEDEQFILEIREVLEPMEKEMAAISEQVKVGMK